MSIIKVLNNRVLTLRFDNPKRRNALTQDMYRSLSQSLMDADLDPDIGAVLIAGNQDYFTAGNDLEEFFINPPIEEDSAVASFVNQALPSFSKPLLAAVNGPAIGIGTTLLLHCDFVFAGENAMFGVPFVKLGLCPEAGSSFLLPLLVGMRRASSMLLLGEMVNAQQALACGLVNEVLPPADTEKAALLVANRLVTLPSEALNVTKKLISDGRADILAQRMKAEFTEFARLLESADAKAAFKAFLQKK